MKGMYAGVIVPMHKKGDANKSTHHLGITLLNTCNKIVFNILVERIKPYAEEIVGFYQC